MIEVEKAAKLHSKGEISFVTEFQNVIKESKYTGVS